VAGFVCHLHTNPNHWICDWRKTMKRLLCLLLALTAMLSLCACQGNFGSINLKDPVNIPENGVIDKSTIMQIKNENAIAVFVGTSGDFKYEWTVFASTIRDAKTVNLGVQLSKTDNGSIRVVLNQAETFGFSASLAIHLNERWSAQNATARAGENAFATVSLTGSKHTILNVNLDGTVAEFVIQPESFVEEQTPTQNTQPPALENTTDSTTVPTKPEEETVPATKPTEPEGTTNPTKPQEPTQPVTEPTKPAENGGKDKYHTDPVPEGKPKPVEPEDQEVDKDTAYTCTFSIECSTILNNLSMLEPEKLEMVPFDGMILAEITVVFYEGESVFDVLQRVCRENNIHMEASWTPMYNSAYIEGIHNLYEFDCGALSGWMYRVNGWYPNYGCSRYQLLDGDVVEWRYTCDLGNDVGGGYAIGG
jgi:hypothetical protein